MAFIRNEVAIRRGNRPGPRRQCLRRRSGTVLRGARSLPAPRRARRAAGTSANGVPCGTSAQLSEERDTRARKRRAAGENRPARLPGRRVLTIMAGWKACSCMIEQTPALTPGDADSIVILPHRSLSRAGLWWFLAAQGVAALGFALLAAAAGNVFAPAFAVLELVLVAACLLRVWRASGAGEVIVLGPSRLEVVRMGEGGPAARFHPYWARLTLQSGRWPGAPSRLLLRSHGREIEIGAFLSETERKDLAGRLTAMLAQAAQGAPRG
jgi:uncharacterized membrane protein